MLDSSFHGGTFRTYYGRSEANYNYLIGEFTPQMSATVQQNCNLTI